ncbi:hypothetical protein Tco_1224207 [Tanacetum coccineum]
MDEINYQEPIPVECKCKLPLMELTSWTPTNLCRRFLVCPNRYKTGVKKCKKFYWYDLELDNSWYRGHLYGMYGQLNPHKIQDIATVLTSHEQLIILQDEFTGLQAELAQTQKNARTKEKDLKVARMINKLCVKLSAAIEEHRMFTQELELPLGGDYKALVRETEERADEKMVFIEKLKGNTPF